MAENLSQLDRIARALCDFNRFDPPLPIGTKTPWGKIAAVGRIQGERYYWIVDAGDVAMMPASVVE